MDVDELLPEDELLDQSCLTRDDCIQDLIREASPECLYCALESLETEEDD